MPAEDARLAADTLVQADLWGHQSHGVMRLSWYVARLQAGVCDPVAKPEFVVDAGALAVLDGQDGMGQVLTARAMQDAVRRAKAHGIGAVALRNSNHFGTAMYFTLMAARAGCVGFLSTNASPAMAPWGGRKKTVGTNPWSWAAPAGTHAPMVLDIANTGVARGKDLPRPAEGPAYPGGLGDRRRGRPTTDPAAAIDGIILPMAQHKGYAIAVMMDMLSGVLTGSAFGAGVRGPYQTEHRSGAGQFMIALDIAAMQPPGRVRRPHGTLYRRAESGAAGRRLRGDRLSGRDRGAQRPAATGRTACSCPRTRWRTCTGWRREMGVASILAGGRSGVGRPDSAGGTAEAEGDLTSSRRPRERGRRPDIRHTGG